MKLFNKFFVGALYVLLYTLYSTVYAQSPVTYPVTIPSVGTCQNWAECKKLCDDPINKQACYTWALQTNLIQPKNEEAVTQAMKELACTSKETCAAFCTDPKNKDQCVSVGKKYKLVPDYQKRTQDLVGRALTTNDAKIKNDLSKLAQENTVNLEELPQKLSGLCSKKENAIRCQRIADAVGIKSATPPGPGGCTNQASCRAYCDNPDNFSECTSFGITGPQGCTSELSCYQVCQAGGCTNTKRPAYLSLDPQKPETLQALTQLSKSCGERITALSGQTVLEAVGNLKNVGVCDLYDVKDTKKETNAKRCSDYLKERAQQSLNPEEFSQYCASLPIIPKTEKKANDTVPSEQSVTAQMKTTCSLLETLGISGINAYSIAAEGCKSSVQTLTTAREECNKPAAQRKLIKTAEDERKYCLSAPGDMVDYQQACKQNLSSCQTKGYDWYCSQYPDRCVALIEGKSVAKLAEQFTQGVNVTQKINALNISTGMKTGASGTIGKYFEERKPLWDVPMVTGTVKNQPLNNTWSTIPYYIPPQAPSIPAPSVLYRPPTTYPQEGGTTPTWSPPTTTYPTWSPSQTTTYPTWSPPTTTYPTWSPSQTTTYPTWSQPTSTQPTWYPSPTIPTTNSSGSGGNNSYTGSAGTSTNTYVQPPTSTPFQPQPTYPPTVQGVADQRPWWQVILEIINPS